MLIPLDFYKNNSTPYIPGQTATPPANSTPYIPGVTATPPRVLRTPTPTAPTPATVAPAPVSTTPTATPTQYAGGLAPDDPRNKYNTATGALNPNYKEPVTAPTGATGKTMPTVKPGEITNFPEPPKKEVVGDAKGGIPSPYASEGNARVRRIGEIGEQLTAGMEAKPDLETIRQEKARLARTLTDEIRAQYDRVLSGQADINKQNEARTRALNVSSGLVGSDFATAHATETEKKGQEQLNLIYAERDAKINAILADVEDRASEQYQAQRKQYMEDLEGDFERQKAFLAEDRAKAKEQIQAFVKGGYSYSALKEKEPKVLEQLKSELGISDLQLETMFSKNGAEKLLKTENLGGGHIIMFKQGADGKIVTSEYVSDIADDEIYQELDGVPYAVKKDENGNYGSIRILEGFDKGSKSALELENKRLQNQKLTLDIKKLSESSNFTPEFQQSLSAAEGAVKGGADSMEVRRRLITDWPEYRDIIKDFLPEPRSSLF